MSKYKLLRDLPKYDAGTVYVLNGDNTYEPETINAFSSIDYVVPRNMVEKHPDWFEPLPDGPVRWRADNGADYFAVTISGHRGSLVVYSWEAGAIYDEERYKMGNYFRTKEQAQLVADAIKAVLGYIHTPIESVGKGINDLRPFPEYEDDNSFIRLADEARKALQPTGCKCQPQEDV